MRRTTRFAITQHRYNDIWVNNILYSDEINKLCMQEEMGEDSKSTHLQVFITTKKRWNLMDLKHHFKFDHIETAKGNDWQNYLYCTKEETSTGKYKHKRGSFTEPRAMKRSRQGSSLDALVEDVKLNKYTFKEIAIKHPKQFLLHSRGLPLLMNMYAEVPETRSVNVILLQGTTGTGKSHAVRQYCHYHGLKLFTKQIQHHKETQWFDGAEGCDVLLLDDFDKGQVEFRTLLTWVDIYKIQVQTKGGTMHASWNTVFITTNTSVREWYPNEDQSPLFRRIDQVVECNEQYVVNYWDFKTKIVPKEVHQFEENIPDAEDLTAEWIPLSQQLTQ